MGTIEIHIGHIDRQLCSAQCLHSVPDTLDWRFVANSSEYWVNSAANDYAMPKFRIAHTSDEGAHIAVLIKRKKWEQLENYIWTLLLRNIDISQMKAYINHLKAKSFDEGYSTAKSEFRDWLNG